MEQRETWRQMLPSNKQMDYYRLENMARKESSI